MNGLNPVLMKKTPHKAPNSFVVSQPMDKFIHVVRGQRVMIDADLARLYRVTTKAMLQAVRRNLARFPEDFMFQFSGNGAQKLEVTSCDLQSSRQNGGHAGPPYAFTEHGVAMLSAVLHSDRAVAMSLAVIRALSGCANLWPRTRT